MHLINKLFSREELKVVSVMFLVIVVFTLGNFLVAERKGRDAQRKEDLRHIERSLERFRTDNGSYPESKNGKIMACGNGQRDSKGNIAYQACEWGFSGFPERVPSDPLNRQGYRYLYISTVHHYQIYAALEGTTEAEYSKIIASRNLFCGEKVCNMGLASPRTPLDKSLEEYENELQQQNLDAAKKNK